MGPIWWGCSACPPVAGEREGLLAFLAQQRHVLRVAAFGLTDEQARATRTVSTLSLGGLISHVTATEQGWIDAGIADLGRAVPVPDELWYPDDLEAWSVRGVLLHLIEETARHAGHADIVREALDGATAYPLMAAAEGWPATDWMQPWAPPAC